MRTNITTIGAGAATRLKEAPHHTVSHVVHGYLNTPDVQPLFLCGPSEEVLKHLPNESIDCCMTSPPYWNKREYANGGIGLEGSSAEYVQNLLGIIDQVQRTLKNTGSFWLNIGDTYKNKNLVGIPWRIALAMMDRGWTLRNEVIWNKIKGGPDNSNDKLRNVHEHVFHFVKDAHAYSYDTDAIRAQPHKSRVVNGAVVSASGVRGVRYRRQIELSTALSSEEREHALAALDSMLDDVRRGDIADFRMIIRGQQRATHSNSELVSGRARELHERGFYFLRYHPNGSKPSDVWDILPEDTQHRALHFAPYPADLCRIPIAATCPRGGVVLDPFCGTGTTNLVAFHTQKKSIGIDVASEYIREAELRCASLL